MKLFTAKDGTEMSFELVKEIFECQQFKITVESQPSSLPRTITLAGTDEETNYKTLEILLAYGEGDFERLKLWADSVEH